MMAAASRMSGEALSEDARPFVAAMAEEEGRVVLRCRPYATFAQPPPRANTRPHRGRGVRRLRDCEACDAPAGFTQCPGGEPER
jgi:hypothetical protein